MNASIMRYFKTTFLVMMAVALTACMSTKSFLDPSFPKISYEELQKPLQPKKLKVTAEFQRNGKHLEKVDQSISDSTERILRASGLAIPGSDGKKIFIVSADSPAKSVRVTIFGGVRRFRKTDVSVMLQALRRDFAVVKLI